MVVSLFGVEGDEIGTGSVGAGDELSKGGTREEVVGIDVPDVFALCLAETIVSSGAGALFPFERENLMMGKF